jgi:hypothetical protein
LYLDQLDFIAFIVRVFLPRSYHRKQVTWDSFNAEVARRIPYICKQINTQATLHARVRAGQYPRCRSAASLCLTACCCAFQGYGPGCPSGCPLGCALGCPLGCSLGCALGCPLGCSLGCALGCPLGCSRWMYRPTQLGPSFCRVSSPTLSHVSSTYRFPLGKGRMMKHRL